MNRIHETSPAAARATAARETLDSRRLQAFVLLARAGSFAAAARAINLTPSAMSHSIRTFEEELATPLFHRRGHQAFLTQAGQRLLPRAERILEEMQAVHDEIREAGSWGRGELRICAPASVCRYVLPPALCEFRESFPECVVSVQAADTPASQREVLEGSADLAIGVVAGGSAELEAQPLFSDQMRLYVSPHHAWAQRGRMQKAPAGSGRYILYSLSSVSGRQALEQMEKSGIRRAQIMEVGSQEAIMEMTRIGIGAAVLPDWVAAQDEQRGLIVTVPGRSPVLTRKWQAWWRKDRDLPVTTRVMLGLVADVCRDLLVHHGRENMDAATE